ncbi:RNA-directed DNA polymerase, partial [Pseudomonas aeruginosa]
KYPIPNISDVLDKLGKCQYFTTLDLASGFYQVETNPEDIPKTAFNVEHGHFEFLRMPMGLKNSPATFQRVMDNVLKGLQNVICLVYLDDIIVFSTSLQEHLVNLEKVFQRLRESNFKIQMDKSEFLKLETAYLG